jgi:hypothetical protein
MLKDNAISRDIVTANGTQITHLVAGGTYSPAPTLLTQGFFLKGAGGRNYDAYEVVFSFDATADATTMATVRPYFLVPSHDPGLAGGTWLSGKFMEQISVSAAGTDVMAPVRRINSVPTAATKMYLQVVAIVGTAPVALYATVYGLEGNVATVTGEDIEVTLDAGDIEIGAVELKDHTTDDRAHVKDANVVPAVADHVLVTQIQSTDGLVTPSGAASTAPIWVDLAHAPVSAFTDATHTAPTDFTATFLSNVTLTCAGAPFTIEDASCRVVFILFKPAAGSWSSPLINGANSVSITAAANVITVTGAGTPFAAGDTYWVGVQYQQKAYQLAANLLSTAEAVPLSQQVIEEPLIVTTNVAAITDYPSADGLQMLGAKHLSVNGVMIDADATISIQVFGTNDPNVTAASRRWVALYGYRTDTNTVVNSISCASTTVTFGWDFDNLNCKYVKVVFNNGGGNTNTLEMYIRRMY